MLDIMLICTLDINFRFKFTSFSTQICINVFLITVICYRNLKNNLKESQTETAGWLHK